MSGVEGGRDGVRTSRHTICLCKPIAIAVSTEWVGHGQQLILQGSYGLSMGPCSSMEINNTCGFKGWEYEP